MRTFSIQLGGVLLALILSMIVDILYNPAEINFTIIDISLFFIFPLLYSAVGIIGYLNLKNIANKDAPSPLPALTGDIIASHDISPRESEVITELLEGKSNKQISETLFISIPTVKKHVYNIFRKLGVASRFELIQFFNKQNRQI